MSRVTLEVVPDPELGPPTGFSVASQLATTELGNAIFQLTQLIRAGIISCDEVRRQLGLPGTAKGT